MLVIIDYKGKRIKKWCWFGGEATGRKKSKVYILITDKQNKNHYDYHFVCVLENDSVFIPSTSLIPKETSYIHLTFNEHKFNIPIHAIHLLGQDIPTTLNFSIDFNI